MKIQKRTGKKEVFMRMTSGTKLLKRAMLVSGILISGFSVFLFYSFAASSDQTQQSSPVTDPSACNDAQYMHSTEKEWDPFSEMEGLQRRMNRIFDTCFRLQGALGMGYGLNFDMYEKDNAYVITLDIPGMEKDKIELAVTDHLLTVSGERKYETEEQSDNASGKRTYYRQERSFGAFKQSIPLPEDAQTDAISAAYTNGVLTITVPRIASEKLQPQSQKIQIM